MRKSSDFPEDLLLLVLSKIEDAKTLARASLVSTTWKRLCRQVPNLVLDLPNSYRASRIFQSVMSNREGLQSFTGIRILDGKDLFGALRQSSSTLQKIVLWNLGSAFIPQGLYFPHLHVLEVTYSGISLELAQAQVCTIKRIIGAGGLLHFNNNPGLRQTCIFTDATVELKLEGCDRLTSMHLQGWLKIPNDGFTQLQICVLNLYIGNLDTYLEELLMRCRMLQTLEIKGLVSSSCAALRIRNASITALMIIVCWKQSAKLILDGTPSLTALKLKGRFESLEILQRPCKLQRLFLGRGLLSVSWDVVSSLLSARLQIHSLKIKLVEELSRERIMEVLNSLDCLEHLTVSFIGEWSEELDHPKYFTEWEIRQCKFTRKTCAHQIGPSDFRIRFSGQLQ